MSEIIKILDSRFVTDRDIRVTKALVSSVEYSELKQRITELEQQLKTASGDAELIEKACKITDDEISEFRNKYAPVHRIGIEFGAEWMRQEILKRLRQQQTNGE